MCNIDCLYLILAFCSLALLGVGYRQDFCVVLAVKVWWQRRKGGVQTLSRCAQKGHRMTWQAYHRLADIYGYLDYLSQTYSRFVSVQTIGSSVEGRPLRVVKISSGRPNSPAIWIDGGIHAREWISPASVTYIINELTENQDAHGEAVRNVDWYILPVLNPDGYEYSHRVDRLWRKNRKGSGRCAGTDLNRNFGYKWGGAGSSKEPCKEIYAGTGPFSEPETSALSNFVQGLRGSLKAYVSFHSYGQYILHPWGYARGSPPDQADLSRVGKKMANAMRQAGGASYTVGGAASTLYPASGGSDDWARGVANIKYTYTIELRDRGYYGFILPAHLIVPVAREALAAVKTISSEITAPSS
ncbi:carboxypeptidase B-like isoform X2 [Periplaneta americana]|uniref:carboxypeptidase B-like isoform X2 n=1 Tax=Periplaneta americana TaxID=6978 RepID=UPI0037E79CF9